MNEDELRNELLTILRATNGVFTGIEADECVKVVIHGSEHFLHATTARELHNMLGKILEEFNKHTPFPV